MNNISALSYLNIDNKVPKSELLLLFAIKYNESIYTSYFNSVLSLNLERTPVYVIKKSGDRYEYEIYFYRYDPYRKSSYTVPNADYLDVILDDYSKFIKEHEFSSIGVAPYTNFLFRDEFIIVSYDVNKLFFEDKSKTIFNYYFHNSPSETPFKYLTKEEDSNGNIVTTNKYGLFDHIFELTDKKKYLVDLFESENCIIFYAFKPKTDTHAFYYEKSSFRKFIFFLEYFNYDEDIINYVKQNYNDDYDFCFSYDMDDKNVIQKTAIFSIF